MQHNSAPAGTTTVGPPAEADPVRAENRAFTLLAAVQFVLILAMSVLNIALPDIQRQFGVDRAGLALLSAAYGMSFSGLLLLGGQLADRYGAHRVFVTGTSVFGVGSALAGLSTGEWMLLGARFAQGIGAALAVPAAMALVSVIRPEPARHARAMAFWGGLAASGGTAGMLLSGVTASWDSWRWAFALPVAVSVLAVAAAPRVLPRGPAGTGRGQMDILGAVLVTAGITLVSYGLVEAPERGWTSPAAFGPLAGGAVLLVAFAAASFRAAQPLLPPAFLASPRRAVALLAVFLGAAGITTLFFFLALYFQQVRGYSPMEASAAFLPFGATLVLSGLLVGRLIQRFGPRVTVVSGLVTAALGLALLSRIGTHSPYAGFLLAGLVLFPAGVAQMFAGATVTATTDVPEGQAGLAGAVVTTALEAGPAVGLAALVTLAAARTGSLGRSGTGKAAALTSGYSFAFGIAAAAFAVAAVGAAVLLRPRRGASHGL